MEVNVSIKGDEEVKKRLKDARSLVNQALGESLHETAQEAIAAARAAAPAKPAAIREKITAYGYGFANQPTYKGISRESMVEIKAVTMATSPAVVVVNEYYIGRFFELGFGPKRVKTRAHSRRAKGRKSWARPRYMAKILRSYTNKKDGTFRGDRDWRAKTDKSMKGIGYSDRFRSLALNRRGGQVWVSYSEKRMHHVDKRPYFVRNVDEVATRRKDRNAAVVAAAMKGNRI